MGENVIPVNVGQPLVKQNQVGKKFLRFFQATKTVFCFQHLIITLAQKMAKGKAYHRFIINYQRFQASLPAVAARR